MEGRRSDLMEQNVFLDFVLGSMKSQSFMGDVFLMAFQEGGQSSSSFFNTGK